MPLVGGCGSCEGRMGLSWWDEAMQIALTVATLALLTTGVVLAVLDPIPLEEAFVIALFVARIAADFALARIEVLRGPL